MPGKKGARSYEGPARRKFTNAGFYEAILAQMNIKCSFVLIFYAMTWFFLTKGKN